MPIQQVSFQECSNQFPEIFERVLKNHEIISVCKESEQEIVILDAKEYSSLIETLYLLSTLSMPTACVKVFLNINKDW